MSTAERYQGYCPYCSDPRHGSFVYHNPCPKVKAIEYYPDGSIKRVEFKEE